MKRFLLFKGDIYYPSGGWDDFHGDYDTVEEATKGLRKSEYDYDWWHVIDTEKNTKVAGS